MQLIVGEKYKIKTKSGIVEKYLSRIENEYHYFVLNKENVNSSKIGWMMAGKGTVHNIENIIGLIK